MPFKKIPFESSGSIWKQGKDWELYNYISRIFVVHLKKMAWWKEVNAPFWSRHQWRHLLYWCLFLWLPFSSACWGDWKSCPWLCQAKLFLYHSFSARLVHTLPDGQRKQSLVKSTVCQNHQKSFFLNFHAKNWILYWMSHFKETYVTLA